jgi:hypothetical protein
MGDGAEAEGFAVGLLVLEGVEAERGVEVVVVVVGFQ